MHPHQAGSAVGRLRADEVRRLHALWHRGPPHNGSPKPKPSYASAAAAAAAAAAAGLGPSSSTPFKKAKRRGKRREEKMQRRAAKKLAEQLSLCSEEVVHASDRTAEASPSEIEWPCEPLPVSAPDAGWGDSGQKLAPSPMKALPASQQEEGRTAALRVHQKALSACQDFLSREGSSDDEEDEGEGEEEDDLMDEDGDGGGNGSGGGGGREGSGYFNFFLGLFEEDGELRGYYEKNWEKGEFCCLVCEGIGVKVGKKFVDCVALVQHSSSITKTKRREAHRAFGRAICRVLGWDITRLPSIVLDRGETLGQTLAKATASQDAIPKHSDDVLVDAPEVNGTDNDDRGNYLEADDIPEKSMETPSSEVKSTHECSAASLSETRWGNWDQIVPPSVRSLPTSQDEQGRLATMQVHQKALRTCRDFFSQDGSSDIDEDEEEGGLMDEDRNGSELCDGCGGGEGQEGSQYFNFFLGLFKDDEDLRAYYEKNWEKGAFCCLVCEGIGAKVGKSFGDCASLIQHSSFIRKTKRREAHRAFGRAICCVLGWDVTRLPSIVLDMGETLGQTLAKAKATGLQDDIPKQNGEIVVDVPQASGTDHDGCINYLEVDDVQKGMKQELTN